MKRPYIFCHMLTSLDGKIMGNYMETIEGILAGKVFHQIAFGKDAYYKHQGWLSGRVTTDDNFTLYRTLNLDEHASIVPEGDYLIHEDANMFYVSIDPKGKLGWIENTITYEGTTAQVIEVLCESTNNAYKAFLRKLEIPYIIAGKASLDYEVALDKLYRLFHIRTLMLGGGGVLNWSFIQAGMCDEVSLVIASSADGSSETPTLFEMRKGLSDDHAMRFELQQVEVKEENSIWIRYFIKKEL